MSKRKQKQIVTRPAAVVIEQTQTGTPIIGPLAGSATAKVPINENRYRERVFTVGDLMFDAKVEQDKAVLAYEKCYERLVKLVRAKDKEGGNALSYEIPTVFTGCGKYSQEACALYVLKKIRQGEFTAFLDVRTFKIIVSWNNTRRQLQAETTKSILREANIANTVLNFS